MNTYLMAASIITMFVVLVHTIAGEILIIRPLFKANSVPKYFGSEIFFKETIRATWHMLGLLGLGTAVINFYIGSHPHLIASNIVTLKVLMVAYWGCGGISIVVTKFKHLSWVAFFTMGGLLYLSVS
jgi:hypothetical protein